MPSPSEQEDHLPDPVPQREVRLGQSVVPGPLCFWWDIDLFLEQRESWVPQGHRTKKFGSTGFGYV